MALINYLRRNHMAPAGNNAHETEKELEFMREANWVYMEKRDRWGLKWELGLPGSDNHQSTHTLVRMQSRLLVAKRRQRSK